jgi:hypothetical protein
MKKVLLSILLILGVVLFLKAQQDSPVNSNYLIEHGISPRVLDAAASLFMQDGYFLNNIHMTVDKDGVVKSYDIDVIFDPDYKDGMDIRIVNKSNNLSRKEKKKLKRYIEKSHYFSRMSKNYLYDESTLKLVSNENGNMVLEFYYQKKDVDPYLRNIKRMKGMIYLKDGLLEKVVLTNVRPLKNKVTSYKKIVFYSKVEDGGYIVTRMEEEIISVKGKHTVTTRIESNVLAYNTPEGEVLSWNDKPHEEKDITGNYDTIKVKLGGPLPLLGKQAVKLGYQLPRPVGVAGFVYAHDQLMEFTGLEVSFDEGSWVNLENIFALDDSKVKQLSTIYLAKADVWLFPFFNVMVIVGAGVNDLQGELVVNEDLRDFFEDLPGWIIDVPNLPKSFPVNSSVTSEIYGGGATFAGGVGDFNMTINYQLMFTKIVEANTTNTVHIITPMVGYMSPFGVNFMIGAQGQFYNTQLKGFFELDDSLGNSHILDYKVDFEPIKWNGIVGFYKGFSKHWEMSMQVGFGQRTSVTAVFGYRL